MAAEIIGGEKIKFPSDTLIQNAIKSRIMIGIGNYLMNNKCGYIFRTTFVRFSDENIFIPDLSLVLKENEKILSQGDMIRGAPDMVVEVLSHSTRKKDLTIKKDVYEAQGVKEYWIVDPRAKSVMVYLLQDGKYFLDEVYTLMSEDDLKLLDEDELADVKHEVPVSILGGLNVPLDFIFSWGY